MGGLVLLVRFRRTGRRSSGFMARPAPQRRSRGGPMRTFPLLRTVVAAALVSVALAGGASALEVGQKAPDFALNGVDGKPVKLSDLTAKGPVVIYTFIAAFTPT